MIAYTKFVAQLITLEVNESQWKLLSALLIAEFLKVQFEL